MIVYYEGLTTIAADQKYAIYLSLSLPTVSPSYVPRQLSRDTLNSFLDYLMFDVIHYLGM